MCSEQMLPLKKHWTVPLWGDSSHAVSMMKQSMSKWPSVRQDVWGLLHEGCRNRRHLTLSLLHTHTVQQRFLSLWWSNCRASSPISMLHTAITRVISVLEQWSHTCCTPLEFTWNSAIARLWSRSSLWRAVHLRLETMKRLYSSLFGLVHWDTYTRSKVECSTL